MSSGLLLELGVNCPELARIAPCAKPVDFFDSFWALRVKLSSLPDSSEMISVIVSIRPACLKI